MEEEIKRAADFHYESPILQQKTLTDANYHRALLFVLQDMAMKKQRGLVIASHHLFTVQFACQKIQEMGLSSNTTVPLYFAQLMGMGDYLTYGLSYINFNVCKLVPYGMAR